MDGWTIRHENSSRKEAHYMSINAIDSAAGYGDPSRVITNRQQLDQQDFLNLLITQLTNQDPLSPEDDKEFISQMAQFSSLQGVQQMNNSLSALQSASLIGRTVRALQTGSDGTTTMIAGVVKAARFDQDGAHLLVNDMDIRLDQVTQVQ
jgi:flagellar basal-body rod modification protein FlgD